jgi:beta-glucosidase
MSNPNDPLTLSPRTRATLATEFTWGVATSAYQIEGAAAADGRGPSIWDTFSHSPGKTVRGDTGDVACDHDHRWAEDVALMAGLGVDAYRFSIAWSRVQPLGHGAWNAPGLAFYDRLVDGLLERGIRPDATLYHWDLPQGLQDRGGWAARDTALRFADYAAHVACRLGDRLASIASHNEPWCTATLGHARGKFAPGAQDEALAADVSHHLLLSDGLALQSLRAAGVRAPLGIVLNQSSATAATRRAADQAKAATEYAAFVRWYMEPIFQGGYPQDAGIAHYALHAGRHRHGLGDPSGRPDGTAGRTGRALPRPAAALPNGKRHGQRGRAGRGPRRRRAAHRLHPAPPRSPGPRRG